MAGGGGGAKADEPQPHPPKDQLPNISYCITSPPPWRKSLSDLLHISHHAFLVYSFQRIFCVCGLFYSIFVLLKLLFMTSCYSSFLRWGILDSERTVPRTEKPRSRRVRTTQTAM